MKRPPERKRKFRSYTFNFSTQKARTTIITVGLATAVFSIIICVVAVQLIAGGGQKGLAGRILHSISSNSLRSVMSQEIPLYASLGPTPTMADSTGSPKGFSNMLLYLFTDIDAGNPLTMLGFEVPGMAVSDFQLVTPDPKYDTPPAEHIEPSVPKVEEPPRKVVEPPKPSNEPLVYIYHSHNREAFLPELKGVTDPDKAYDADQNIEKAGGWIVDELKQDSVPAYQTLIDYWTKGNFNNAYDYSRPTIEEQLKDHKDLKLIFDVHRDSGSRQETTRKIGDTNYASVFWIVGGGNNPHADQNEALAKKLNDYLEKMYPGISHGVWKKGPASFDTRYNQDLSPNMVLIEVGGPYNNFEEIKRTSEALGKVIAAYLKDVQALQPQVQAQDQGPAEQTTPAK